ncbi:glycoside hydrolase [Aspergillus ellipticus CBS 707.79]|uniref:chitinase n=1 Tax=Aspergillus ellipticus CBS 707.79 TaxID=1448320 RepID=A0A319DVE4_9EURO|nr:glycoside hydrolase [Aspergillus ellipticus CBS 707.79]
MNGWGVFIVLVGLSGLQMIQANTPCSATDLCTTGCCGNGGIENNDYICGTGPTFCGEGNCTSTCDYKAECNPGGWPSSMYNDTTCPLNVCCSEYGFCGTTSSFCGDTTVTQPSCDGTSSDARTIGYYEGWSLERSCQTMDPDQIPLGYYTHLNYAFAYIDQDLSYIISAMDSTTGSLYQEVTALKDKQPDLEVWISVGGWAFNDAGSTEHTFSDLAASETAQDLFFASLITFMVNNAFDGIDIDWEYPVASDRYGSSVDFDNYVTFLKRLRSALNNSGYLFGISITLPSSYWYMQNFDIVSIDPIVDWFNIMTYDLHGVWDGDDPYIGAVALAHTNLTEIKESLDLLWRNNINPSRVNLGLGFYGRSFTMSDPSCMTAGCPFSGGGREGPCTATSGILSDVEIRDIIADGATVTLDEAAAVQIVTWDTNQWVSYDDATTIKMKIDYANSVCLGGTMVWAVDLDDTNGTSINYLGSGLNRTAATIYNDTSLDTSGDLGSSVARRSESHLRGHRHHGGL